MVLTTPGRSGSMPTHFATPLGPHGCLRVKMPLLPTGKSYKLLYKLELDAMPNRRGA